MTTVSFHGTILEWVLSMLALVACLWFLGWLCYDAGRVRERRDADERFDKEHGIGSSASGCDDVVS